MALKYYEKIVTILKGKNQNTDNYLELAVCYNNIAITYYNKKEVEKAREYA